jgi:hypothetical protein
MSLRRTTILAFLLAAVLPAGAAPQGLGDTAARERAKRQAAKAPAPAKSFTNEDLERGRPPGQAAPAGEASPAPAGDPGAAPVAAEPSEPDQVTQEKPFMDAVMGARSALAAAEARVQELQDRLNPMSINFVFGAATSGDQTAEAARVREELQQAEAQLGQARQALAQANQALEDFRMGRTPQPSSDH